MQLRRYLQAHDISVLAFAKAIGVGVSTVYRYLGGTRLPSSQRLERIAEVTGGQVLPNDFHQFAVVARCPCEPRA